MTDFRTNPVYMYAWYSNEIFWSVCCPSSREMRFVVHLVEKCVEYEFRKTEMRHVEILSSKRRDLTLSFRERGSWLRKTMFRCGDFTPNGGTFVLMHQLYRLLCSY